MTAIIELLLPILKTIGEKILAAIKAARQSGELTAEQEAAYLKRVNEVFSQPYAQPRDET